MESQLRQVVNKIAKQEDVVGVSVADANGLSLMVSGDATVVGGTSGYMASLVARSERLFGAGKKPVIMIQSESKTIIIRKENNITTGIFRNKKKSNENTDSLEHKN